MEDFDYGNAIYVVLGLIVFALIAWGLYLMFSGSSDPQQTSPADQVASDSTLNALSEIQGSLGALDTTETYSDYARRNGASAPTRRYNLPSVVPIQEFYSDYSSNPSNVPTSDTLSGAPADRVSGAPADRVSGAPADRVSGAPADRVSGAPADRVSRMPTDRVSRMPTDRTSRTPREVKEARALDAMKKNPFENTEFPSYPPDTVSAAVIPVLDETMGEVMVVPGFMPRLFDLNCPPDVAADCDIHVYRMTEAGAEEIPVVFTDDGKFNIKNNLTPTPAPAGSFAISPDMQAKISDIVARKGGAAIMHFPLESLSVIVPFKRNAYNIMKRQKQKGISYTKNPWWEGKTTGDAEYASFASQVAGLVRLSPQDVSSGVLLKLPFMVPGSASKKREARRTRVDPQSVPELLEDPEVTFVVENTRTGKVFAFTPPEKKREVPFKGGEYIVDSVAFYACMIMQNATPDTTDKWLKSLVDMEVEAGKERVRQRDFIAVTTDMTVTADQRDDRVKLTVVDGRITAAVIG